MDTVIVAVVGLLLIGVVWYIVRKRSNSDKKAPTDLSESVSLSGGRVLYYNKSRTKWRLFVTSPMDNGLVMESQGDGTDFPSEAI